MIRALKDLEIDYINGFSEYQVNRNPFSNILVYIIEGEIVAYIDYSIIYERAEINYIFVLPGHRKKGIGRELLQYVLDHYDIENITLEVNVHNEAAIHLYEKIGFKVVSKRPSYYDGVDAYLMEMML